MRINIARTDFVKRGVLREDHRGRQGPDHEGNFKQTNKQTTYLYLNLNVMGSHWRVLSKGVTLSVLNFNKNLLAAMLRKKTKASKVETGIAIRRLW